MKKNISKFLMSLLLIMPFAVLLSGCLLQQEDLPKTYSINVYSANGTMGIVYGSGTYTENEQVTIVAMPKDGYKFVRWDDNNTTQARTITVTSSKSYTAYFEAVQQQSTYTISVSSANSTMGTVYGTGSYAKNEQITIVAVPKDGYKFVRWNDNNTTQARTITVTSSKSYTAYFEAVAVEYVLDSINIYVDGYETKIESILLQKLLIEGNNGSMTCIDLTGGNIGSYYAGNDGMYLYHEYGSGTKQYTRTSPLTIYVERNNSNIFSSIEDIYINYEIYEDYDDSTSWAGRGNTSYETLEINPQSAINICTISLSASSLTIQLNFVRK